MNARVAVTATAAVIAALTVGYFSWTRSSQHSPRSASPTHVWPPREVIKPIYCGEIIEARIGELLPSDAAEYASNYRYCLHWSGEEAYDKERAEEIAQGLKSCDGLEAARDSLQLKYPRGSPVDSTLRWVIARIVSDSDDYAWDDPHHSSKVLNRYYEAFGQQTPRSVDELIARRRALADTASQATRNMVQYMIKVETGYLSDVIDNIDRLHPVTAEEVRAARIRWERETGEKVSQRQGDRRGGP